MHGQVADRLSLTVPNWKRKPEPVMGPRQYIQDVVRQRRELDFRSLQVLAAHTVPPGSEALFQQSLRNLWAVKNAS